MGCCNEIIIRVKQVAETGKQIASGYIDYTFNEKPDYVDDRIWVCQQCPRSVVRIRILWCKLCKCNMYVASWVRNKKCEENRWPKLDDEEEKENGGKQNGN